MSIVSSIKSAAVRLDNYAQLISEWQAWTEFMPHDRCEHRSVAFQRLKDCLIYRKVSLDLADLHLSELPAHFPAFLKILNVNNNHLTRLPEGLPIFLEELYASGNTLIRLPAQLPGLLFILNVDSNCLRLLPTQLPLSLRILDANDNQLVALPLQLPPLLKNFYVSYNNLRRLPPQLPGCLTIMDVSHNQLRSLPQQLPDSLKKLYVRDNRLACLPMPLPSNIEMLDVSYNQLTQLPPVLPFTLRIMHASHNQLTMIQENLCCLSELYLEGNPLVAVPTQLPHSLRILHINRAMLTYLPHRLPQSLMVVGIDVSFDFSDKLRCWYKQIDIDKWRKIQYEANANAFTDFLRILYQGKNRYNQGLKRRIIRWLDYLAQEDHQALRAQTFALAQEAAENCVDRASFYFTKMYILQIEHKLIAKDVSLERVIETLLGLFRLQILEQIAAEKVKERRQNSPGFSEDLEVYLAYQYKLRKALLLPVYIEFQFTEIADVSDDDIKYAEARVAEKEREGFLRYWFTESALWTAVLEKWDAQKKAIMDERYLEAISAASFKQAVAQALAEKQFPLSDMDAERAISSTLAATLFYQYRQALTRECLASFKALSLLDRFSACYALPVNSL